MKKIKKMRKIIASVLLVSLLVPTNLPSIAGAIEDQVSNESKANYASYSDVSFDVSNDESEAYDIRYIEGIRVDEKDFEGENVVYFGKHTIDLVEGENAIYYLPVYRIGDLSRSETIKIHTLDLASLYGKDYELVGDNISEYESPMTLLERSIKGEHSNKLTKKKFSYDEEADELYYEGEEEVDFEKISLASISEMIENGDIIFGDASDSDADYIDESETEVSPETEPTTESVESTYAEEPEEDETTTTAAAEESTSDTEILAESESTSEIESISESESSTFIETDATNETLETSAETTQTNDEIIETTETTEVTEASSEEESTEESEIEETTIEEETVESETTVENSVEGFTNTDNFETIETEETTVIETTEIETTIEETTEVETTEEETTEEMTTIEETTEEETTTEVETTEESTIFEENAESIEIFETSNTSDVDETIDSISPDETLAPIVIPDENVIYINEDSTVDIVRDVSEDAMGKSLLAIEKEKITGKPTRVTEKTIGGSLTDAIMSKLSPEIIKCLIYSAEQEITFAEDEDTAYIKVKILDDELSEGTEMFSVMIFETENATTYINTMSVNIIDNEEPTKSKISFDKKTYNIRDGEVTFKLKRDGNETALVSVNVETVDPKAKTEMTHGVVVFAPYEMEREVTLKITNETDIKLSEYKGAIEGKIVEAKAKKPLLTKLFGANNPLLGANNNTNDKGEIYSRNIQIGDKKYIVRIAPKEVVGTIYDQSYTPELEVGKYFTMVPREYKFDANKLTTSEKDKYFTKDKDGNYDFNFSKGMWGFGCRPDYSDADWWFYNDGAQTNFLESNAKLYWYNWRTWKTGQTDTYTEGVLDDSRIHAIYYRNIFPEWHQSNYKYGGHESKIWYNRIGRACTEGPYNRNIYYFENKTRGGEFSREIDTGSGLEIKNENIPNHLNTDRVNDKIHVTMAACDWNKGCTPKVELYIWGLVAMYKKFQIKPAEVEKLNYKIGLNPAQPGSYSYQSMSPAGFQVVFGAQTGVTGEGTERLMFANATPGVRNNMVFSLFAENVNGQNNIFGTLKGYKVLLNYDDISSKQASFVYPDDYVKFLRTATNSCPDVIDYSNPNKLISAVYNDLKVVSFDNHFIDFIESVQKYVANDNDFSNTNKITMEFTPIFNYKECKVEVVAPTGLEEGHYGGVFKDINLRPGANSNIKYHAGDKLDLTVLPEETAGYRYRSEGFEVSTNGGLTFNTYRGDPFLVLDPKYNYIIRPAVSLDFNRIEFTFSEGVTTEKFLKTPNLIPQSYIEAQIAAHPQYIEYRGKNLLDCNPGAANLAERAKPTYGKVYDLSFEAKKENESDSPIVLFTDKMNSKIYQGPTFYHIPRSIPTDNIISIGIENVAPSKKKKHAISGSLSLHTTSIRYDGQGDRDTPLENYLVTINEQGYGETHVSTISGTYTYYHRTLTTTTDENGHFEIEPISLVAGYPIQLLLDDGVGDPQIFEFTPSVGFNDDVAATESIPLVKMPYSPLIPYIVTLNYDFDNPLNRVKTDFTKNEIHVYEDTLYIYAQINVPIIGVATPEEPYDRIKEIIYTLRHSDGEIVETYKGVKSASSSNLYKFTLPNMHYHVSKGDYLTAQLVDMHQKSHVVGEQGQIIYTDILYPEVRTGFIFGIENVIPHPKTIDFEFDNLPIKYDVPLMGITNPTFNSGTTSLERIDWEDGNGYTLAFNMDALMYDSFAWTTEERNAAFKKFRNEVKDYNDARKLKKDKPMESFMHEASGNEEPLQDVDEGKELSDAALNKSGNKGAGGITDMSKKPLHSFDLLVMMYFQFVYNPASGDYVLIDVIGGFGGIYNISWTKYTFIGAFPVYLNLQGTVQGTLIMGSMHGVDSEINRRKFESWTGNIRDRLSTPSDMIEFNLILLGKANVGIGMACVTGVRGFATTNLRFRIISSERAKIENGGNQGDVYGIIFGLGGGFAIDLLVTSFEFKIVNWQMGRGNLGNYSTVELIKDGYKTHDVSPVSNINEEYSAIGANITKDIQANEELTVKEYDMGSDDFSSFGQIVPNSIPTETNRVILFEHAAERTRPKIKQIDENHKFVLFLGKNTEAGDASRLYYTIGTKINDGSTNNYSWSVPEPIDTDDIGGSTFDSQPDIHMYQDEWSRPYLAIAWIDADKQIDDIADFRAKYNSLKVSCKILDLSNIDYSNLRFSNAVTINKGNYFYQNPKLSLYSTENKLICTFFVRDINKARKIEDLADIYGFYSTVAYSIIDVNYPDPTDPNPPVASISSLDSKKDIPVEVLHKSINDPFISEYPTVGMNVVNLTSATASKTFYLVSAYTIDEDNDVYTENDKELYLSISKLDEENNIFISYFPIRLTTNDIQETAVKLTHIKNKIFLSWISGGRDFCITDVTKIIELLFVQHGRGNATEGWRLSLNDNYMNKDKTQPDWYKLSIYDFDDISEAKTSLADPDPRIELFNGTVYESLGNENIQKISKRLLESDNESSILIDDYDVVSDEKDIYIFYTDFSGEIKETGKEIHGLRYTDPGIRSYDLDPAATNSSITLDTLPRISDPVMITHFDYVFDEIDMDMSTDGRIDLISNYYKQWIGNNGEINFSQNQLTWVYFEPAGSVEVDKNSIEISPHLFAGSNTKIGFKVENLGLSPAKGYDMKIEAVKTDSPELLGDIYVKRHNDPPVPGNFINEILIYDGHFDEFIDTAKHSQKYFNWQIPDDFDIENYYIKFQVTETAPGTASIIPRTNEVYKKVNHKDNLKVENLDVYVEDNNFIISANVDNIGNKISPDYKLLLINNKKDTKTAQVITLTEKSYEPLPPASTSEFNFVFKPKPSDFDEYGRISFKISAIENGEEVSKDYYDYYAGRPMFVSINNSSSLLTMTKGATSVLNVTATPWNEIIGEPSFTSYNESVVSVDEKGKLLAVDCGSTDIEVYYPQQGLYDTITVEVKEPYNPHPIGGGGGGSGGGGGGAGGAAILQQNSEKIPNGVYKEGDYTWKKNSFGKWNVVVNGEIVRNRWIRMDIESEDGSEVNSSWYFMDKDGAMHTGWYQDEEGRYYFMQTYNDNTIGTMLTGRRNIGGLHYYFNDDIEDPNYGSLLVNTIAPDGQYANANGELVSIASVFNFK